MSCIGEWLWPQWPPTVRFYKLFWPKIGYLLSAGLMMMMMMMMMTMMMMMMTIMMMMMTMMMTMMMIKIFYIG